MNLMFGWVLADFCSFWRWINSLYIFDTEIFVVDQNTFLTNHIYLQVSKNKFLSCPEGPKRCEFPEEIPGTDWSVRLHYFLSLYQGTMDEINGEKGRERKLRSLWERERHRERDGHRSSPSNKYANNADSIMKLI